MTKQWQRWWQRLWQRLWLMLWQRHHVTWKVFRSSWDKLYKMGNNVLCLTIYDGNGRFCLSGPNRSWHRWGISRISIKRWLIRIFSSSKVSKYILETYLHSNRLLNTSFRGENTCSISGTCFLKTWYLYYTHIPKCAQKKRKSHGMILTPLYSVFMPL